MSKNYFNLLCSELVNKKVKIIFKTGDELEGVILSTSNGYLLQDKYQNLIDVCIKNIRDIKEI